MSLPESVSRSYRPGDWFGIFGEHATVVLPPGEKARVAAIWALVTIGGSIVASLPVRLVFWLCQRTPRAVLEGKGGSATQSGR